MAWKNSRALTAIWVWYSLRQPLTRTRQLALLVHWLSITDKTFSTTVLYCISSKSMEPTAFPLFDLWEIFAFTLRWTVHLQKNTGGPEFTCLVQTRVQVSCHTWQIKRTIRGNPVSCLFPPLSLTACLICLSACLAPDLPIIRVGGR